MQKVTFTGKSPRRSKGGLFAAPIVVSTDQYDLRAESKRLRSWAFSQCVRSGAPYFSRDIGGRPLFASDGFTGAARRHLKELVRELDEETVLSILRDGYNERVKAA